MDYCRIGDIYLDNMPIWTDRYDTDFFRVRTEIEETLRGVRRSYRDTGSDRGRTITLDCTEQTGWQARTTVDALKADELAMALTEPVGTRVFEIVCGALSFSATVIYRSDQAGGAVKFKPLFPITGLAPDDFQHIGTIQLMVW